MFDYLASNRSVLCQVVDQQRDIHNRIAVIEPGGEFHIEHACSARVIALFFALQVIDGRHEVKLSLDFMDSKSMSHMDRGVGIRDEVRSHHTSKESSLEALRQSSPLYKLLKVICKVGTQVFLERSERTLFLGFLEERLPPLFISREHLSAQVSQIFDLCPAHQKRLVELKG